jgi:PIN domain nuclease of toxin-antitoxin system
MRLLLDTHTFLWLELDDPKLGKHALEIIRLAENAYVSSITITEVIIKQMLGKMPAGIDVPALAAASGIEVLPYNANHASALASLPTLARRDPFDRMLAAQAISSGLAMVTTNEVLLNLSQLTTLDAKK